MIEFEFGALPAIEFTDGPPQSAHGVSAIGCIAYRSPKLVLVGQVESFAIFLKPLGLWQMFGIPTRLMADTFFDAEAMLGREVQDLWHRMAETPDFGARVAATEAFLLRRLPRSTAEDQIISRAALSIFQQGGAGRMDAVAADCCLSMRQFERRFIAEIGISPKRFARIARFQTLLDAKIRRPERSWTRLAHEFGFHDQMHMIRDFELMTGMSPEKLVGRIGDLRPLALAASDEGGVLDFSVAQNAMNFRSGSGVGG